MGCFAPLEPSCAASLRPKAVVSPAGNKQRFHRAGLSWRPPTSSWTANQSCTVLSRAAMCDLWPECERPVCSALEMQSNRGRKRRKEAPFLLLDSSACARVRAVRGRPCVVSHACGGDGVVELCGNQASRAQDAVKSSSINQLAFPNKRIAPLKDQTKLIHLPIDRSTMPLSCRFYEQKFPEVEDVVMVNVRQIAEMGAYVSLIEYDNIEGMVIEHTSAPDIIRLISNRYC